jgi:hypothetical protein
MTEDIRHIRLCSNCKNAPTCTFPKDPNRPSFYCEEFEIEELPPQKIAEKGRTPPTDFHFSKEKDTTGFRGLCGDCENHRTCGFPKLDGGVWHCEEYR